MTAGAGDARSADWQERAGSFGAVAAQYALLRPSYPSDAVAFLVGGPQGDARARRVLDLGAGTGLLAEVLVAGGHEVVAVDPSAGMLAQLTHRLPAVTAVVGTAEELPLPDSDVDVLVAGQAAHWFDAVPAAREMRRVLRHGGSVGFVWNLRDDRVPWVAALTAALAPEAQDHQEDRAVVERFASELNAAVTTLVSGTLQRLTPEQVVGRVATSSYATLLDPTARQAYLDRVRDLLATHPDTRGRELLELPYVTRAWRLTPR
jgi:SAM-dependent methyltransferase